MKEITIDEKKYNIGFSFNSIKCMEDFDVDDLNSIEKKPFKIIGVTETLLYSALNNDPKKYVSKEVATAKVEESAMNGELVKLLDGLIKMLYESDFFKNLQENQ